jgi:SH3-like domain-containing protein
MRTFNRALLSLVALATLSGAAGAATVEPKVQLLVREKPSSTARIVDRVPPGKKLPLLGRSGDGAWTHVQTGKKDGWVPSAQLRGNVKARKATVSEEEGDEVADEEESPRKPLAKRRSVRPEAWVSSSRYHDGEDNKLTISATKAELFGRPQSGGSVLGILRRGEVVSLVRKSSDKKWCLVDIGGGDVAWIESKTVKPGAAKGAPMPDAVAEEAPSQIKKNKKFARTEEAPAREEAPAEVAERAPEPEPAPAPPPPVVKKTKKQLAAERAAERANEERASAQADAARDEEKAPLPERAAVEEPKPGKRSKKALRVASRGDLSGMTSSESTVTRQMPSQHGNNYFGVGVRAGIAILSQRFTSNGTGLLSNYESNTNAVGIQIGLGYQRAIGQYFRLGIDGSYGFAGAAGVRYRTADGSNPVLQVQAHAIDAGVRAGVHINKIGGVDIAVRLGGELQLNLIEASAKIPIPSDRILGMTIGLAIDMPALFYLSNRPFGLRAYAGGLVPADRGQTGGLEEGKLSSTYGAAFGGSLTYSLYKGLSTEAAYTYGFTATHFEGQARRNSTITSADRGSAQHLIALGLSYSL